MRDSGPPVMLLFVAAAVVAMSVIGKILKAVEAWFNQLGRTLEAFADAIGSFFVMLGHLAVAVALIAVIAAVVIGAVYFTWKYIKMVRRATEIKEMVESRMHETNCELNATLNDFRHDVAHRIGRMERDLSEALKEPEAAPLLPAAPQSAAVEPPTTEGSSELESNAAADAATETEPPVSQPY